MGTPLTVGNNTIWVSGGGNRNPKSIDEISTFMNVIEEYTDDTSPHAGIFRDSNISFDTACTEGDNASKTRDVTIFGVKEHLFEAIKSMGKGSLFALIFSNIGT